MNDFTVRRRAKEQLRSAIPGAPPAVYRAFVTKPGRRSRLYRIDPIGPSWQCEVWIGAALHRTTIVETATRMHAHRQQYEREVADLLLDGWTRGE